MGLVCGRMLADELLGQEPVPPPEGTALGALYRHVTRFRATQERYEPQAITYGILPPLPQRCGREERRRLYAERALKALETWVGAE